MQLSWNYQILFQENTITYNPDNYSMDIGVMFGFIKAVDGIAVVSNRIFEMRFYNYFLSLAEMQNTDIYKRALRDKEKKQGRSKRKCIGHVDPMAELTL